MCELVEHGQDINSSSIGIEFTNHPFGAERAPQDCLVKEGITSLQIPAISEDPSRSGPQGKTCLYIPSQTQLEAPVTLLNALFAHPDLTNLDQTWMSVININPAKLNTEKQDDLKAYFIINNARAYIKDAKYAAINGNVSSGGWSLNAPGVFYHQMYGSHRDGMIPAFYTWLRIG